MSVKVSLLVVIDLLLDGCDGRASVQAVDGEKESAATLEDLPVGIVLRRRPVSSARGTQSHPEHVALTICSFCLNETTITPFHIVFLPKSGAHRSTSYSSLWGLNLPSSSTSLGLAVQSFSSSQWPHHLSWSAPTSGYRSSTAFSQLSIAVSCFFCSSALADSAALRCRGLGGKSVGRAGGAAVARRAVRKAGLAMKADDIAATQRLTEETTLWQIRCVWCGRNVWYASLMPVGTGPSLESSGGMPRHS